MWLTEMQKEEEAFSYFFLSGGGWGGVNFHIDILEVQMQSKILGGGGGGGDGEKKKPGDW